MNEFQKSVRKEFTPALAALGFKQVAVEPDFASFAASVSAEMALYVLVHDERSEGQNLEVALWAAPLSNADDSLDSLGVGLKTIIASAYDTGPEFFRRCACKIEHYLPAFRALQSLVSSELAKPFFESRRAQIFACERAWWNLSRRFLHPEAKRAVEVIEAYYRAKKKTPPAFEQAKEAASLLIRHSQTGSEGNLSNEIPPVFWTLSPNVQIDVVLSHFMSQSEL